MHTTLPRRFYADPDFYRAELERFYFDRWICAGRAITSHATDARRRKRDRPDRRRRDRGVPHRVPPSRDAARRRMRPVRARPHPMPVPQLDIRPRRTIACGAAHATGLFEGRLPAAPCRLCSMGRTYFRVSATRPDRPTRPARPACPPGSTRGSSPSLRGMADGRPPPRPADRIRREGELEVDRPQLQRVPPLSESASRAEQVAPLPRRGQRRADVLLLRWRHGIQGRRRDDEHGWQAAAGLSPGTDRGAAAAGRYFAIIQISSASAPRLASATHTPWPRRTRSYGNVCEFHFHPSRAWSSRRADRRCGGIPGCDEQGRLVDRRSNRRPGLIPGSHAGTYSSGKPLLWSDEIVKERSGILRDPSRPSGERRRRCSLALGSWIASLPLVHLDLRRPTSCRQPPAASRRSSITVKGYSSVVDEGLTSLNESRRARTMTMRRLPSECRTWRANGMSLPSRPAART